MRNIHDVMDIFAERLLDLIRERGWSLNEFSKLTENSKDVFSQEMDTNKRSGHIEIISKPKKVTDEDD